MNWDHWLDDYLARYQAAFDAAHNARPGGLDLFAELAAARPDDPLVAFYLERLKDGETGIKIKMTEK